MSATPARPVQVTKRIEFDTGHRITHHGSKCRNLHGHRYALEVTVEGPVQKALGQSEGGMVIDFGILKDVMTSEVHDDWDHSLLLWHQDPLARIIKGAPDHDSYHVRLMPEPPTAENMVRWAFTKVQTGLAAIGSPLKVVKARLFETPTCWADYMGEQP